MKVYPLKGVRRSGVNCRVYFVLTFTTGKLDDISVVVAQCKRRKG